MQEACRKSCEFCNASKNAFPEGKEPLREDTAAHACPDGSDLGGGEVLVKSDDPRKIAAEVGGGDDDALQQLSTATAKDGTRNNQAVAADGGQVPIAVDKTRALESRGAMGGCARDERLLLDTALASWPLLLINGLLLVLVGYLLRGYADRRARMRRRRIGSGDMLCR